MLGGNTIRDMSISRRSLLFLIPAALPLAAAAAEPADPGSEQSPIDFKPGDLTPAHLPELHFDYTTTDVRMTYISTDDSPCDEPGDEETIRAAVPPGAGSLRVGPTRYDLQQVHWHTRSEHRLNGHSFPLEQHLVHADADGNLLVVGVWLRHGRPHRTLGRLFGELPTECTPDHDVAKVDLNELLPRQHGSMRYPGSLTTSPYTEDVSWVMLTHPVAVSRAQVHAFAGHFPSGNSRGVQPLAGRTVRFDPR